MNTSAPAPAPEPLGPLDPLRRYTVEDALRYLGISRFTLYADIRENRIQTIKDRNRRFVPGSEIARVSRVPA
jgi:excisionase family DNA binding protein